MIGSLNKGLLNLRTLVNGSGKRFECQANYKLFGYVVKRGYKLNIQEMLQTSTLMQKMFTIGLNCNHLKSILK
jgi:hypothetical protein